MALTPVRALKVKVNVIYFITGNSAISVSQLRDFPVPVPPHLRIF